MNPQRSNSGAWGRSSSTRRTNRSHSGKIGDRNRSEQAERAFRPRRFGSSQVDLADGLWSVALRVAAPCSIAEPLLVALDEVL